MGQWLRVYVLLFHWNQLIFLVSGLECACTTFECMTEGKTTCNARYWCYSENYSGEITRGCIDKPHPIQCDNMRSTKFATWEMATHCCKKDFCNKEIIPTSPAKSDKKKEEPNTTEENIILPKKESSECENSYSNNSESSKMINPIYIAVPVAGVCVLLALIIFAMYLLRRRTDYYERYKYPTTVSVPHIHQHHQDCSETKCANTCKLNRCTDSERSSSGSETKLFL